MLRISVMVSGGGSNLQAIINGIESGLINDAKIVQVISSTSEAYALKRADDYRIIKKVIGENYYKQSIILIIDDISQEKELQKTFPFYYPDSRLK